MTFTSYVRNRVLLMIPTFLVVTLITFTIVQMAPGDPVMIMYGLRPGEDFGLEQMAQIRHELGLDRPIYVQYYFWLIKLVRGDFGRSLAFRTPVRGIVGRSLLNTLKMQIPALLIAIAISIPAGVISAVKHYSKIDYLAMSFSLLTWSMPWFWYSLMSIYVFAVLLGWFPAGGMFTLGGTNSILDQLHHLILPVFVLGTMSTGFITRLVRSSMLEVLRQDYIVVARSKGLQEKIVIYKHALKNALLPTVTVIGLYVGVLVGGAAITETVFTWPGTGLAMVEASRLQDYPVIMGVTLIVSLSVLFSTLLTDILYAFLDPRIRYA